MMSTNNNLRLLLVVGAAFCITQITAEGGVLQLTEDNFDEKTDGKTVFLKFFAPWCGHCKALAPDWEKLANDWQGHKVGLVAEVDCTDPAAEAVCAEYQIEGFPTLMYGDPNSPEIYEGARDYDSLAKFAKENISKPVCSVGKLDACTKAEKKIIADLRKKTREELDQITDNVHERIMKAEEKYEAAVEKLQQQFEEITKDYNKEIDAVRVETNFKWVQQVLLTDFPEDDEEESSAAGEEL